MQGCIAAHNFQASRLSRRAYRTDANCVAITEKA